VDRLSTRLQAPPADTYDRADVVLYDVDHSGESFVGHIYLNNPDADHRTELAEESGYAGSFTIFGHGGCFGEEGHCDLDNEGRSVYDRRPPHPLTGQTITVVVTDALKRIAGRNVTVTVVPVGLGRRRAAADVLRTSRVRLLTYRD
jgi:hypothetical protein